METTINTNSVSKSVSLDTLEVIENLGHGSFSLRITTPKTGATRIVDRSYRTFEDAQKAQKAYQEWSKKGAFRGSDHEVTIVYGGNPTGRAGAVQDLETRLGVSIFYSRFGGWKIGDAASDDDVSTGFANLKALEASYLADLAELDAWEAYNSKKQAEHEAYLDSLEVQK